MWFRGVLIISRKVNKEIVQKELERILKKFGPRRGLQYLVGIIPFLPMEEREAYNGQIHDLEEKVKERNSRLIEY